MKVRFRNSPCGRRRRMGIFGRIFKGMFGSGIVKVNVSGGNKIKHGSARSAGSNKMPPPSLDLRADVRSILQTEFKHLEMKENYAVNYIDPSQTFGGPADFALLRNGRVIAVVMIIEKGKFRTKRVQGVELACKKTGVRFANLYTHFSFSREHAVAYIRKFV